MEVVWQRCAGIDIGKKDAKVCVRVQGRGRRKTTCQVTTWPSTTAGIVKLRSKLVAERVERVIMESTGDYWRPFFYILSEELDVVLAKASEVKGIPGRKSDVTDAEWLADLGAHNLVRASFVPGVEQRHLRDLTRARAALLAERTRDVNRLEKVLEDACIKLSAVVSDLQGVSARQMLAALVDREDDPATMADLAKGVLRKKIDQLTEALTGRFEEHHAFMVRFHLGRIDAATADLTRLDAQIDALMSDAGFLPARDLLQTIPGFGKHGAEELLAEIGIDMSRFPSPAELVSWIGFAPGSYQSAGKRKNVPTRPGNKYAKRALGMAAKSAIKTRNTFLAARFTRLCARRGYPKALVATGHIMVTAIWYMLSTGTPYHDLGADYYTRHNLQHRIRREIDDLEAAGYIVTKKKQAA